MVRNGSTVEESRAGALSIGQQLRASSPWLLGVSAVVAMMGVVILAIHFSTHIDVELLLADPADRGHLPGYTGLYTYAGAFALLTGGAVCLFTAMLLNGRPAAWPPAAFLVSFGVLIAWLGIDDLFMFHEWFGLAIAELIGRGDESGARSKLETVVFVGYGIAWVWWIMRFWRVVRETTFVLLLLTVLFFGLSISVDVGTFFFPEHVPNTAWMPTTLAVTEEMFKLAGIFFAFAYAWKTSMGAARRMLDGACSA